jgi:hypothetical protein
MYSSQQGYAVTIDIISGKPKDETRSILMSVLEARLPEGLKVKDALYVLVSEVEDIDYEDPHALTQRHALNLVNDVGLEIFGQPSKDSGGYLFLNNVALFTSKYPHLLNAVPVLLKEGGVRLSGKGGNLPGVPSVTATGAKRAKRALVAESPPVRTRPTLTVVK